VTGTCVKSGYLVTSAFWLLVNMISLYWMISHSQITQAVNF